MTVLKLLCALCFLTFGATAKAADISSEKLPGGPVVVRLNGEIKSGDDERFRQISLRFPKAVVHLQSNGGALLPALEIGRIIRIAGYNTVVAPNTNCVSACALIWLGGHQRYLSGNVGFHAAYFDNNGRLQESGAANALVGNYLTLLGLSSKAILFATTAPPDRVLWLTSGNREASGIDFHLPSPPPPILISPPAPVGPTAPESTERHRMPPSRLPVQILNKEEFHIQGSRHVQFEFKYLGFKLQRFIENPENPEAELRDFIDRQIDEENGWLFYGSSGSPEKNNLIFYYIDTTSIVKSKYQIELWAKENHEFNNSVVHREDLIYYKIYCGERSIAAIETSKLDAEGNIIDREYYDPVRERVMPGMMDEALWETVCS